MIGLFFYMIFSYLVVLPLLIWALYALWKVSGRLQGNVLKALLRGLSVALLIPLPHMVGQYRWGSSTWFEFPTGDFLWPTWLLFLRGFFLHFDLIGEEGLAYLILLQLPNLGIVAVLASGIIFLIQKYTSRKMCPQGEK